MYFDNPVLAALPVVISCPRSGLNWVRYCVEKTGGLPTPGLRVLIDGNAASSWAFLRTHDAQGLLRRPESAAWSIVPPQAFAERAILLLIRDPRELIGRILNRGTNVNQIGLIASNLNFFFAHRTERSRVFYYQDFIRNPASMMKILEALAVKKSDGAAIHLTDLEAGWDDMRRASRDVYNVNQDASGGSMTQDEPDNPHFHRMRAPAKALARHWENVRQELTPNSLEALRCYLDAQE